MPHNVGGHPGGLSKAEREKGHASKVLVFADSKFRYFYDELVEIGGASPISSEIRRWIVFWKYAFAYDIFHFNFGQKFFNFPIVFKKPGEPRRQSWKRALFFLYSSLVGQFDLWFLKLIGKKIVVTFQGDDIRQGDFARKNFAIHFAHEIRDGYYDPLSDRRKRKMVQIWDKYADTIFALNPDLLQLLPPRAKFLPYAHINPTEWAPHPPEKLISSPIRILHAPSDREVKGTHHILRALDSIIRDGFPVEVILVEHLTFDEARKQYERADLVVDQLLAGWYGGFAAEAMALGKPVISYIRTEDTLSLPEDFMSELPIINADPTNIETVLRHYITHPQELHLIGIKSRDFCLKWHSSDAVAQTLIEKAYSTHI